MESSPAIRDRAEVPEGARADSLAQGFVCPRCESREASRFVRGTLPYWQCALCRHQTSLVAGTVFEATKLALVRWFLPMLWLTQAKNNVSALELKRQLGVNYRQRLAHQAQTDAGHVGARVRPQAGRAHRIPTTPTWAGSGRGKPGRGSREQGADRGGGADRMRQAALMPRRAFAPSAPIVQMSASSPVPI